MQNIDKDKKIYIAGHNGMVGAAIARKLKSLGFNNVIGFSSKELNLKNQALVTELFKSEKPAIVIDAAARVGGILANTTFPYQFLMENMQIQNNLIDAANTFDCEKFIFLGSSCIYPKFAPQPMKESDLLTGDLESTNEWYAIAKISGVKACEAIRKQYNKDFVSLMPTNLYGPFDNFDLGTSHVMPAMIRKFDEAKRNDNAPVSIWGTGAPMREFLHVDDLASAVVFAMENRLPENLYNVGAGIDLTIKDLALMIQEIVGHNGEIVWDKEKPDGTPRKLMDVSKLHTLGWKHKINLTEGVKDTYSWYLANIENIKEVKLA
jgi:GDP-L-fucose synthase